MRKLLNSLFNSQGLRSAALMTGGNIFATIVSAIAMIIFSRLLGPADFGIFSVLFSLLLILSKVGDAGVNTAVQREVAKHKTDSEYIKKVVQTGSYLKLIVTLVLLVTGLFAGNWVGSHWLHVGQYNPLVTWIFVLSGGVVLYEYVISVLQGKEYFAVSILANLIQSVGKLAFALIFIFVGISMGPVILLYVFMPLLSSLSGLLKLPAYYFLPRFDKGTAAKLLSVAKWTSIAIISATIADNLDIILVQNYLSSYDTGLWSAATKIVMIASLAAWSLGTVLNVRVASYHDRVHLHAYLKKASLLALFALLAVSALAFVSFPAIKYTVGTAFIGAVVPLNLLFISTAILTATTPFIALFYLFDRTSYFAVSGIIGTAVLLLADILLIPGFGLVGAGYARILTRLVVIIYTLYAARSAYREKYAK